MKKFSLPLACILALNAFVFAHGNMEHILGVVTAKSGHTLSVKATDGTTKVVEFDGNTQFLKDEQKASPDDVQVGSRVVIHAAKHNDNLHAEVVKIGRSQ
jgi:hypothetical protein